MVPVDAVMRRGDHRNDECNEKETGVFPGTERPRFDLPADSREHNHETHDRNWTHCDTRRVRQEASEHCAHGILLNAVALDSCMETTSTAEAKPVSANVKVATNRITGFPNPPLRSHRHTR